MVYVVDAVVVGIVVDFDPYGGEYTKVNLGFKLPIPKPPGVEQVYPPPPKPIAYKHVAHIIIPREKWTGQYNMWQEFKVTVKDNGEVEIKKAEE
jgi:hypothetical protein